MGGTVVTYNLNSKCIKNRRNALSKCSWKV